MEQIKLGKYVELAYEILTVDNDGETQVFKFTPDNPDRFIYGLEPGMLEAFAKNLSGLKAGDKFDFTLSPEEAFGDVDESMIMDLDKNLFVVDGEFDSERVFVGGVVPMQTTEGHRLEGFVTAITPDKVTIDFNHQLAGETVRYRGQVLALRDATPEELNPPKHHCGCGCEHDHKHGDHCHHDHKHGGHCHHDHCEHCD